YEFDENFKALLPFYLRKVSKTYHLNDINLDHIKPYESFVVEI
ncbi:Oligo-1,6-glucosidase, partial [human gut metagenome]